MSRKITEKDLKELKIKVSSGNTWYSAGKVTKPEVASLVNDIIPVWKKLKLNENEIAMGLSITNVEC